MSVTKVKKATLTALQTTFLVQLFGRVDCLPFRILRALLASYQKERCDYDINHVISELAKYETDLQRTAVNSIQSVWTCLKHSREVDQSLVDEMESTILILCNWAKVRLGPDHALSIAAQELATFTLAMWLAMTTQGTASAIETTATTAVLPKNTNWATVASTTRAPTTATTCSPAGTREAGQGQSAVTSLPWIVEGTLRELSDMGWRDSLRGLAIQILDGKHAGEYAKFRGWSGTAAGRRPA